MFINTVTIITRLIPTITPPINASIILSPSFPLRIKALPFRFRSVLHRSVSMHIRENPSQHCDLLFLFSRVRSMQVLSVSLPFIAPAWLFYALTSLSFLILAEQCRCLHSITYQSLCLTSQCCSAASPYLVFAFHGYANPSPCSPLPIQNSSHLSNSNSIHS